MALNGSHESREVEKRAGESPGKLVQEVDKLLGSRPKWKTA